MDRRTRSLRISGSGLHDSYRQPWQSLSLEAARACDARARCVGWAREVWDPRAKEQSFHFDIEQDEIQPRGAGSRGRR